MKSDERVIEMRGKTSDCYPSLKELSSLCVQVGLRRDAGEPLISSNQDVWQTSVPGVYSPVLGKLLCSLRMIRISTQTHCSFIQLF